MDLGLQDKHAIVTGGSRGIGKAIARELAREGADVAIVARSQADLEATARELAAETNRRIVPRASRDRPSRVDCRPSRTLCPTASRARARARATEGKSYLRKRQSGRTSLQTRRGAMPSVAW